MQADYRPSKWLRELVHIRDQETCQLCGTRGGPVQVAHRVAWPNGPTTEQNLYLLCQPCNNRDRVPWGLDREWKLNDFPQSRQAFDAIRTALLERILP